MSGTGFNRINRIFLPTSCNFLSGSLSPKNFEVKRAWLRAIFSGSKTDDEVLPRCARVRSPLVRLSYKPYFFLSASSIFLS
jgi:hypothetical protein